MRKRRGGYRQNREKSKLNKSFYYPSYQDPDIFLSIEDMQLVNGKTEDAYRVQFEISDLNKVLEGV